MHKNPLKKGENSKAQTLLAEINDWCKENKFHLHPQKCKELRISFTRDDKSYEDVLVDQTSLNTMETIKILGVTIQRDYTFWNSWDEHVYQQKSWLSFMLRASKLLFFMSVKSNITVL